MNYTDPLRIHRKGSSYFLCESNTLIQYSCLWTLNIFYDLLIDMMTANDARLRINKAPDTDQSCDFTADFNLTGCQQTAKHCDGEP